MVKKKKKFFYRKKKKKNQLRTINKGKIYLKNTYSIKRTKLKQIIKFLRKKIEYSIHVKITPNNIFCVLKDNKKNKTILLISAGILKIKISKKKLKFVNKLLVQNFIFKIKEKLKHKTCIVKISGPKKIIKFVSRQLIFSLNKSKLLINVLNKKVFNGCRAKKMRRKKRKGLRILK
jgi:ribosomal protein S11